jgi:hypothetical protein
MSKKDRIAIVVSILYLLFPLLVLMNSNGPMAVVILSPLLVYWGYRFIKNDISFLKSGEKDEV